MRYTAEILPYHDYDFETSIKELAGLGFKEVNLWSSAKPLAHHVNPGDDPKKILRIVLIEINSLSFAVNSAINCEHFCSSDFTY